MAAEKNPVQVVALTGASGFIGKHLLRFILNQGHQVRVLVHKEDIDLPVQKFYGSVTNPEILRNFLDGVDMLFHLAGALGSRVISNTEFFDINQQGTRCVLDIAQETGVKRIVYFSSAGVYGRSSGQLPLKETDRLNARDIYEVSKLAGESVALGFSKQLNISIIRPGWVYGEGDKRTFKLIKQIHSGLFFIAGRGKVKHSPIYIGDLIQTVWQVGLKGGCGEIYNVGNQAITVNQIVNTIARSLGKKTSAWSIPMIFVYPLALVLEKIFFLFKREAPLNRAKLAFFMRGKPLDSTKVKKTFSLTLETDFKRGIAKTIAWYKKNHWL